MPIKLIATGKLTGPIREIDGAFWFEIEGEASKNAPKGLPAPSDAMVTVICNSKQMRPCRELIEQGDKVIATGELALDVPVSNVQGDVAMVAYQLTTVTLDTATKKAKEQVPASSQNAGDGARVGLPDLRVDEPVPFPLSAVLIPPDFVRTGLNAAKLDAARQELAAGIEPGPIAVALMHGHPVLQDGYRRYFVVMEAGRPTHPVVLTETVRFPMSEEQVAAAAAATHKDAPSPDEEPNRTQAPKEPPAPQQPQPPKGAFTCGKCPQKVHPKLAVLCDGKWCCPDCAGGTVNPVTNPGVRFWERGFPATEDAVKEFIRLTGFSYGEQSHATLHVRLSVLLGQLMRYNQGGERRAYINQGLIFHIKQGEIYTVTAGPAYGNQFRPLSEMVEIGKRIDGRD